MLLSFVLPIRYDIEHEMSVYQGGLFLIETESEEVYQSTPPLRTRQIGETGNYPLAGSNPS